MARVLIALPANDFDPTESGVPWLWLSERGHEIVFATPDGRPARADQRMLDGNGLGLWAPVLMADRRGRDAYAAMQASAAFRAPQPYAALDATSIDALLLPGGHAPGMRPFLESTLLQALAAQLFAANKPVGAVCHGVLLLARARRADGRPLLHGRRSTALLAWQEQFAWRVTRRRLGDYYRTYPQSVQAEVCAALASPRDFVSGPPPLLRDTPTKLSRGFALRDGNYVSARWPGDAHRFAQCFAETLG